MRAAVDAGAELGGDAGIGAASAGRSGSAGAAAARAGTSSGGGAGTQTGEAGASSDAGAENEGANEHLTITPSVAQFGKTTVGSQSATVNFVVSNASIVASPALLTELSGNNSDAFEIVKDTCSGSSLAGGTTCTISARFAPSASDLGARSASLRVTGTTSASADMNGEGLTPSALSASPSIGQFDPVTVGTANSYSELVFDVSNAAGAMSGPLSAVLEGDGAADFAIKTDTCSGVALAGNSHCSLLLRFTPKLRGQKTATLLIEATPGGTLPISLSARGLSAGAFSIVPLDTAIAQPVTVGSQGAEKVTLIVTNDGDSAATPQVIASETTEFSLVDNCSSKSIAAASTCTVIVTFAPKSVGNKTTVVSVAPAGLSAKATIHAVGRQTRALAVAVAGNGTGTVKASAGVEGNGVSCPGDCSESYYQSSATAPSVTLTASYDAGTDVSWSGTCAGSKNTCTLPLSAASTAVTVTFSKKQFTLTVTKSSAVTGATGTVTATNINCGSTCSATVASAATVTLTALPASGYYFGGWSGGGCSGGSLTCTTSTITANTTVTASFTLPNVIFTTSTVYNVADWRAHDPMAANDAVRGADKYCQERAAAGSAAMTKNRTFVSLITHGNTADSSAFQTKLGNKRGWVRPDGLPFGDDLTEFVDKNVVYYPPALDENGRRVDGNTYATAGSGCLDWKSDTINDYRGAGVPTAGGYGWYAAYGMPCVYTTRLYCMSTDYVATVPAPTPTAGRKMFISDGLFTPGSGSSLSSADALCQREATTAGYSGVFKALLAANTPAATAVSRMNMAGTPWVRPDGVPLVAAAADLNSDTPILLSAPAVSPTKFYYGNAPVWTGAASAAAAATTASSCTQSGGTSWAGGTGTTGFSGQPYFADSHYFNDNSPGPCTDTWHLYCFQQ